MFFGISHPFLIAAFETSRWISLVVAREKISLIDDEEVNASRAISEIIVTVVRNVLAGQNSSELQISTSVGNFNRLYLGNGTCRYRKMEKNFLICVCARNSLRKKRNVSLKDARAVLVDSVQSISFAPGISNLFAKVSVCMYLLSRKSDKLDR